ncbi:MFS transporter [Actinoplanes flavus]|uniref:MFS transporter n=1 Tax=Actinoplanes flavus TaxID=2820290 RepID=A0ABS3UX47_9ACTN|nr:MFS transporter [Actinoplanes flavus]MBO3743137.1 MFS transporter [Actinoplanes flavus]
MTSTWAPLRIGVFRMLWFAVLGSQIGTWMQTVGAQWLLLGEPNAGTLVSLVQTAATLPVLLLALPSGVLADSFDRRRLLIYVQLFQLGTGVMLTALTMAGEMIPPLLLLLTFALGCGTAMTSPAYQAVIPELVPRPLIPSAAALGAISMNLARAIGPAIAGVLVAQAGPAAVFAINAVSFLVFAIALLLWRRDPQDGVAEPFLAALRAGGRYVRYAPIMRRLLLRSVVFVVPAMALWALLPLVASRRLGLDASGYGLLLAALGVGAVLGALILPRLRAVLSGTGMLAVASVTYAVVLAVLAVVREPAIAVIALVPAGAAWMSVLSSLNAEVQLLLPGWVRARGLAGYQTAFFGSQALGSLAWGVAADRIGLAPTFLIAAGLTAAGAASLPFAPLIPSGHLNRDPATPWPEPRLTHEPDPGAGPVVVEVAYTIPPDREAEFLEAMSDVRRSRLRTGAVQWGVFRAGETSGRMVELYVVSSWDEHLRQHDGRLTGADAAYDERARALSTTSPEVVHMLHAPVRHRRR